MSDVAELRFWPCGPHALDWSHDGIIAFASDENVELLVCRQTVTNEFSLLILIERLVTHHILTVD
jgi:hypothetical protein